MRLVKAGAVTVWPHLPPDDLRDLAVRVVYHRLSPLVQDPQPEP
ncbi:MAG: hypothetical protein Q4G49_16370 [Paracoccus sp. (in: a-proteobacteria)]|nr:hypothetical protein [Paracoccus sp. (in: a-proteobacteria)]